MQIERKDLPNLGIFRKSRKEEESKMEEKTAPSPDQTPAMEPAPAPEQTPALEPAPEETPQPTQSCEQANETSSAVSENKETSEKTYLKAMPLKDLADLESIKTEVKNGNILILKITPLANKSIQDVSRAVNELYAFVEEIGGDIARLGEERIVICPPKIRIWREKTPVLNGSLPKVT
jgi:uncharacterized protein